MARSTFANVNNSKDNHGSINHVSEEHSAVVIRHWMNQRFELIGWVNDLMTHLYGVSEITYCYICTSFEFKLCDS